MKIAVASVDGTSISQHFGHSAGFIVFDVQDATILSSEWRTANATPHDSGVCQHGGGQPAPGGPFSLIRDCSLVVCGGIGGGAAGALQQNGFQPVILPVTGAAQDVLARYLRGELVASGSATCQCHH